MKLFTKHVVRDDYRVPSNCSLTVNGIVVVIRPLPRDWGMVEDHGAPEAGQLSRAWTRGRKEIESRQTATGAKSPLLDSAE